MALRRRNHQLLLAARALDPLARLRHEQRAVQKGTETRALASYRRYL